MLTKLKYNNLSSRYFQKFVPSKVANVMNCVNILKWTQRSAMNTVHAKVTFMLLQVAPRPTTKRTFSTSLKNLPTFVDHVNMHIKNPDPRIIKTRDPKLRIVLCAFSVENIICLANEIYYFYACSAANEWSNVISVCMFMLLRFCQILFNFYFYSIQIIS